MIVPPLPLKEATVMLLPLRSSVPSFKVRLPLPRVMPLPKLQRAALQIRPAEVSVRPNCLLAGAGDGQRAAACDWAVDRRQFPYHVDGKCRLTATSGCRPSVALTTR